MVIIVRLSYRAHYLYITSIVELICTSSRTHLNSDMWVPLFERGNDGITHTPDFIIVRIFKCIMYL